MSRLRIVHTTGFTYAGDVSASYNEARMLPASTEGQLVLHSHLSITPSSHQHPYLDYWGTRVVFFEQLHSHRELTIAAESLVEVRRREVGEATLTWDALPGVVDRGVGLIEATRQTPLTAPPAEVVERARAIARDARQPGIAALLISEFLHDEVRYVPGVTGVQTTAAEAWAQRAGVCQDIAHLTLGALRSVGIPARYVSGYLHPRRDAELGESIVGESHAWVEWYDGAWRGYDPTNALEIAESHVVVGRGREYGDVPPLRGVYAGSSGSQLFVRVEITRES